MSSDVCVEIYPLTGLEGTLSYSVPERLRNVIRPGCLVRVPLGRRQCLGVVAQFSDARTKNFRLRPVDDLIYTEPVLSSDWLRLLVWMQDYYLTSQQSVLEAMIPKIVREGLATQHLAHYGPGEAVTHDTLQLLEKRAKLRAKILNYVLAHTTAEVAKLRTLGATAAVLATMVQLKLLRVHFETKERVTYNDAHGAAEAAAYQPVRLNAEQSDAAAKLREAIASNQFGTYLLHGVTGSGKTEVYIDAIRKVVDDGGGAIFLVPEIALTPQMVARVRARLTANGIHTTVWHSQISDGERFDTWKAIVEGRAQVVVGARSALFTPVKNLKLIVVDEEHEPAYKQGDSPRYNGRDLAIYRAKLLGITCILGSATPSLESWHNAQVGKYRLLQLTQRVDNRQLPKLHVVDMKYERYQRSQAIFSQLLLEKIQATLDAKRQIILFINRRGYASNVVCAQCGYVAQCEHCSVALTYHQADDSALCHLCGGSGKAPTACPQCRSSKIKFKKFGTQKIEVIVQKLYPQARVARVDTDIKRKHELREIFGNFRAGNIDILVGTQMLAKGLDFPNVTLVGLVDTDISLNVPDFRANERTFQLLLQVAGRSGRGEHPGEVVIQTYTPDAAPIVYAQKGDVVGFFEQELSARSSFQYPPYGHIVRHVFRGINADKVQFYAQNWSQHVRQHFGPDVEIRGPAVPPFERVNGKHRIHLLYFPRNIVAFVAQLRTVRASFKLDKTIVDAIDVDPVDLM